MELFKEVAWTGAGEALTILTGIVIGEISHRTLSTAASLFIPDEKAPTKKVRKLLPKNRKRRNTGNGRSTKTSKSWFSIVQREVANHFGSEILISTFGLLFLYGLVVGFAKVIKLLYLMRNNKYKV